MSLNSIILKFVSIYFFLIALGEGSTQSIFSQRSRNSQIVDSFRRFPHHVTIETDVNWYGESRLCGGSILNEQWILTSGLCIEYSDHLQLHFEKLYYHSSNGSFTIVVNSKDQVHMHPTFYYDIALIHIPVKLVFSDALKPVILSSSPVNLLNDKLAVMPGFDVRNTSALRTTTSGYEGSGYWSTEHADERGIVESKRFYSNDQPNQQLIYGMFRILPNQRCKNIDSEFDEFLQICTENWSASASSDNIPCWGYGNGLLVGWPAKPELVGIYSVLLNGCNISRPAVYTNIAEYLPWIESVIATPP